MFIKAKPSYWTTFPNYAEILTNVWVNERSKVRTQEIFSLLLMVARHCRMWMDWVQVCVHVQKLIFTQFWNPEIWNQGQGQAPFGRPPGRLLPGSWLLVTAGSLGLWSHNTNLPVSPSSLFVYLTKSPMSYKDTHQTQGPPTWSKMILPWDP